MRVPNPPGGIASGAASRFNGPVLLKQTDRAVRSNRSQRYNLTPQSCLTVRIAGLMLVLLAMVPVQAAETSAPRTVYYGAEGEARQSLDIYARAEGPHLPVVLFVHGGGWAFGDKSGVGAKPEFLLGQNIAFVSMNYRLRWDYQVADQAQDIASAIAWLRENGSGHNLDTHRLVLMGQGSGAHLVSLVATDSSYLKAAGLELDDLDGIVEVAGDAYDIGRQMRELGSFLQRRHLELIFGSDGKQWATFSPLTHVRSGKNIPAFALLHVDDELQALQARGFAKVLLEAGVDAVILRARGETRDSLDQRLGESGNPASVALLTFLRARL